jgi:hypothetical protein
MTYHTCASNAVALLRDLERVIATPVQLTGGLDGIRPRHRSRSSINTTTCGALFTLLQFDCVEARALHTLLEAGSLSISR